ncbi:MAG: YlxR family protein [Lachnospiraceae bacterium]|nr:YlxR family protein [Ruminococcus sp.]MCM1275324.1 YlxR family protein [Lachnospiraceae bacterium]
MQNKPEKRVPMRKCVGCGEMIGKKGAVRIVRDKDGNVSVDPTGKKAGRGAYICRDAKCLEAAKKSRRLERSFKCRIPEEIYDIIAKELTADK